MGTRTQGEHHAAGARRRRRRTKWPIWPLALLAFIGVDLAFYPWPWRAPEEVTPAPTEFRPSNPVVSASKWMGRPVHRYSVIPGGAYSAEELRGALLRDRVAAAHYADFNPEAARVIVTTEPLLLYASYRIGDDVWWTRKPLHIAAGEALITDGQTLARARCGNRLSGAPRQPAQISEPDESAMDSTEPAEKISRFLSLETQRSALAFDYFASELPTLSILDIGIDREEDAATAALDEQIFQMPRPARGDRPIELLAELPVRTLPLLVEDVPERDESSGSAMVDRSIPTPHKPLLPPPEKFFIVPEPAAGILALAVLSGALWLAYQRCGRSRGS